MSSSEIERLREVEAKMTPGPWEIEDPGTENDAQEWDEGIMSYWTWEIAAGEDAILGGQEIDDPRANIAGLVAMRNAFPALLDRLSALEEVAEAAREALPSCDSVLDGGYTSCGLCASCALRAALDRLPAATEGTTDEQQ